MSTVLELRCLLADILFDSNGRFLPNVKAYIRSTNYILMFVFLKNVMICHYVSIILEKKSRKILTFLPYFCSKSRLLSKKSVTKFRVKIDLTKKFFSHTQKSLKWMGYKCNRCVSCKISSRSVKVFRL